MEVKSMSIDDIKPYENNPRDNDDAVDSVANSIKEFGWTKIMSLSLVTQDTRRQKSLAWIKCQ